MRPPISLHDKVPDMVVKMAEGNPGAIQGIMSLLTTDPVAGFMDVLHLDDMNIRGSQIWIAYKDHCGRDTEKFRKAIRERDQAMVDAVNQAGLRGNHPHKAVRYGGSAGKREMLPEPQKREEGVATDSQGPGNPA